MQGFLNSSLNSAPRIEAIAVPSAPTSAPKRVEYRQLWNREYSGESSIPSSHRNEPSHALVEMAMRFEIPSGDALDLGCGNGRNSFFLADRGMNVTALDFSDVALNLLASARGARATRGAIQTLNHDLNERLPFKDSSFDLILDSYCLCHFINRADHEKVMQECRRVLKSTGMLVKIHLDDKDEYYLERVHKKTEFGHISYDPANGLKKLHCSVDSYSRLFATGFKLEKNFSVGFVDKVRGEDYLRSIFVSLMKKI